jgi:hypothetical protein
MKRTKFTSRKANICTIEFVDIFGDLVNKTFHAPINGGYVRDSDDRQVCDKLYTRGETLRWSGNFPLIDLIRREYKRRKACDTKL